MSQLKVEIKTVDMEESMQAFAKTVTWLVTLRQSLRSSRSSEQNAISLKQLNWPSTRPTVSGGNTLRSLLELHSGEELWVTCGTSDEEVHIL